MRRPAQGGFLCCGGSSTHPMPMTPWCYRWSILTSSITVWCAAAVTKVLFSLSAHHSLPPLQTQWNCRSSALTISAYCAAMQAHIIGLIRNVIFMFLDTKYLEGWEQEPIWGVITEINSMKYNCSSLFSLSLSPPQGTAIWSCHSHTQRQTRSYSVRTVGFNLSVICTADHAALSHVWWLVLA